jgi:hypothetical protein
MTAEVDEVNGTVRSAAKYSDVHGVLLLRRRRRTK